MNRQRLYEQVVERLRDYAATEGLQAGDRLPPERELAELLGVSRVSIKQAIVVLEVQGMVEARQGAGAYLLQDRLESQPIDVLLARRRRLPDVLDAREALETKLAELAARRRTDEQLKVIDEALEAMWAEIESGKLGAEGDRRFHEAVTAAAHSPLLAEFMASISQQIVETRNESLSQPGRPARSFSQHQRIADAIRAQDPAAAAAAMRRHVRTVSRVRLLTWDPDSLAD
ncbi:MAG: FadR/GntR family transcriptional regulator [Micromonosporaceae bacterium]